MADPVAASGIVGAVEAVAPAVGGLGVMREPIGLIFHGAAFAGMAGTSEATARRRVTSKGSSLTADEGANGDVLEAHVTVAAPGVACDGDAAAHADAVAVPGVGGEGAASGVALATCGCGRGVSKPSALARTMFAGPSPLQAFCEYRVSQDLKDAL